MDRNSIVTYVSTNWETEYMYVFTSNDFTGKIIECNEGDLEWIQKDEEKFIKYDLKEY